MIHYQLFYFINVNELFHRNHDQTTFSHYKKPPKTFAFDHCFWSMDSNNIKFDGSSSKYTIINGTFQLIIFYITSNINYKYNY